MFNNKLNNDIKNKIENINNTFTKADKGNYAVLYSTHDY